MDKIQEILLKLRIKELTDNQYFGSLMIKMDLEQNNDWCTSFASNGSTWFYNREFVKNYKAKVVIGLMYHSMMHFALGNSVCPEGKDKTLWDIAADIECWNSVKYMNLGGIPDSVSMALLYLNKFDGYSEEMTVDQIYDFIKEFPKEDLDRILGVRMDLHLDKKGEFDPLEIPESEFITNELGDDSEQDESEECDDKHKSSKEKSDKKDKDNSNESESSEDSDEDGDPEESESESEADSDEGEGDGDGDSSSDGDPSEEGDQESGESDKEGDGEDESESTSQSKGDPRSESNNQSDQPPIPENQGADEYNYEYKDTVTDKKDQTPRDNIPTMDEFEIQKLQMEYTTQMMKYPVHGDGAGMPGNMKRIFKSTDDPKLEWRDILRNTMSTPFAKNDYAFKKPSKRSYCLGSLDYILPSQADGETIDICVSIDSSGSITDEIFNEFITEVQSIVENYVDYKLYIWCIDSEIYNPKEFTPENIHELSSYEFAGGGGNDFPLNWEFMKKNNIVPEIFVCFSDGGVSETGWGWPDYCETIFVIRNEWEPNLQAPFGTTINMPVK